MANPWADGRLTVGGRGRVMFARMYEDHGVELALFPPGGRVLAIASAGDTARALAAAGHRVTAVDLNPGQLAYARGRSAGDAASSGTAERLQALARRAARVVAPGWRPGPMTRFLELADPTAQLAWWHEHLDRPALRALMFASLRPAALAAVVHKGLHDVLPDRFDVVLRHRIATTVGRWPNATNPWAWRLLLGRECPDVKLPQGSEVEWVHADVVAHLRGVPAGHYDAATLSNVLDGPPPRFATELRDALQHGVKPGGPVVLRTFRDTAPLPGRRLEDRSVLWGAVVEVGDRP